jgi:acyl-CoA reductase-like NAD-dependent aldehyde dehydrogenase
VAFFQAGIPRETISIYPGEGDVGAAVLDGCHRSLIFGGTATVDRYRGNPRVQAHGPGFSKILLGDDQVDQWEKYLDVMVDSVFANSGRGCINCSGIWASRHTREIADALAQRLASIRPLPPEDPESSLAAFTVPGVAASISQAIDADLQSGGAIDVTATHRDGGRVVKVGQADYLLPTIVHCESPEVAIAKKEYMFPFSTVVACPEDKMLDSIGSTLVCSAITGPSSGVTPWTPCISIWLISPVPTIRRWLHPRPTSSSSCSAPAFQSAPLRSNTAHEDHRRGASSRIVGE